MLQQWPWHLPLLCEPSSSRCLGTQHLALYRSCGLYAFYLNCPPVVMRNRTFSAGFPGRCEGQTSILHCSFILCHGWQRAFDIRLLYAGVIRGCGVTASRLIWALMDISKYAIIISHFYFKTEFTVELNYISVIYFVHKYYLTSFFFF